jgi:hypothetical protein
MSDNDFDHEAMFLVAGYMAAQAYAQSQYNNRLNAYVARGFSINQAHAIVRTWYAAYEAPYWSTGGWCLAAVCWVVFAALMVGTAIQTGDGLGDPLAMGLIGLALFYARIRYCTDANQRSQARASEARAWLQERGL